MVAESSWLAERGVTRQLAESYKRAGWLDALGRGAFLRAGDRVTWTGAISGIQQAPDSGIHPGGKTALALLGYSHFLSIGDNDPIWIFGSIGERLPAWFVGGPWKDRIRYSTSTLFEDAPSIPSALVEREMDGLSIRLSSPELAMFEVLHHAPKIQSVEEARLLMEGLATLRTRLVQTLLEACRSVKVKRLLLALADSCGHDWLQRLNLSRVDLGSGKRMLVPGGRLHPKYGITLPTEMVPAETDSTR